jgi:hypothetical protein
LHGARLANLAWTTVYMDYFSATVLVTPVWIALGGLAVLFTRRLLWFYLAVCALLAVVSWWSGVAQLRERRSFEAHEKAVQAGQQRLNAEFEQLAIALKIPPNSPHEMILRRMHAMDTRGTAASARLTRTWVGSKGNERPAN